MNDLIIKHLLSNGFELATLLGVVDFIESNPQLNKKIDGLWATNKIDIIHDIIGLSKNDEHFIPRIL